jgi:Arc/MetJ-type ribon-helix-helix transcriptional regulator
MTRRITVSLPDHLVDAAVIAVESGQAAAVSAYVAQALAERSDREDIAALLADWRAEVGPPTVEETEWAERALGLQERRKRRGR